MHLRSGSTLQASLAIKMGTVVVDTVRFLRCWILQALLLLKEGHVWRSHFEAKAPKPHYAMSQPSLLQVYPQDNCPIFLTKCHKHWQRGRKFHSQTTLQASWNINDQYITHHNPTACIPNGLADFKLPVCYSGDTCIHIQAVLFWEPSRALFQKEERRKPEEKQQGRQIGLCCSLRAVMQKWRMATGINRGWNQRTGAYFLCWHCYVQEEWTRHLGKVFDELEFSLEAC